MVCLGVDVFAFIPLGIYSGSEIYRFMAGRWGGWFAKFGDFSAIISLSTFSASLSLSSQTSNETNVKSFVVVPQIPEDYLICLFVCFQSIFSLLFRLGNLYCSVFQFTDCFLCPFHLLLNPSITFFILVIVFIGSKVFTWFFFTTSLAVLRPTLMLFFTSVLKIFFF